MDIKRIVTGFAGTAMVAGMLMLSPLTASAQGTPMGPVTQPTTVSANFRREKHPEIRMAIEDLEKAKSVLQRKASRDFDGHRAAAVREIDQSLRDLRAALKSDRQ